MPIEILMPALSPTMTEGNLAKWLKKEGDKIKPGDVLAEIETDKATMEVESIDEGILGKIFIAGGSRDVPVNHLIALILEEGESLKDIENYVPKAAIVLTAPKAAPVIAAARIETASITNNETRIKASPLAKRIAENEKIDLKLINGTGPHGRIIKDDVLNNKATSIKPVTFPVLGRNMDEHIAIPNSNIRRVIAKRLLESKQNIPHFYLSIECNIDKLLQVRAEMNVDNENFKLSINDFVIKAVAMALRIIPEANASWTDDAIIQYSNVDISVAVAIEGGLITPIIQNADQKSMSIISNQMKSLAKRARENALKPEEFQGGGFSISNLGMYGIKQFNAIVNPPQSCILAIGASNKRAVVINDEIKIATIIDVSLSCDHRVVDGTVGANFMAIFKKFIENPVKMFV
jgi:pyruvate dehydrogenase E2 component (dihydrolipoamide acetyltransferase)